MKGKVVSILTNDATSLDAIDTAALKAELAELSETPATDLDAKNARVDRIRKMLSLAQ